MKYPAEVRIIQDSGDPITDDRVLQDLRDNPSAWSIAPASSGTVSLWRLGLAQDEDSEPGELTLVVDVREERT